MITMNRITILPVECPNCGTRYNAEAKHGEPYRSPCPKCGACTEATDAP